MLGNNMLGNNSKNAKLGFEDILKEISTIGAGHAASALSLIYSRPIYIELPEVKVIKLKNLLDIQQEECMTVQSKISISEDLRMFAFLNVNLNTVPVIVSALTGPKEYEIDMGFIVSVMTEFTTMLLGGALSSLSNFLLESIIFSPPEVKKLDKKTLNEIKNQGFQDEDNLLLTKWEIYIQRGEKSPIRLYLAYLLRTFREPLV
jgi:chemotaxis protein CheY-P-specific phosphatase CheC